MAVPGMVLVQSTQLSPLTHPQDRPAPTCCRCRRCTALSLLLYSIQFNSMLEHVSLPLPLPLVLLLLLLLRLLLLFFCSWPPLVM